MNSESTESPRVVISLKNVHKRYPMGSTVVHALKAVDLTIDHGDFVAVMGPSGSGKSTLMNILGLLDRPDSGSYLLEDQEVGSLDDDRRSYIRNRMIGFIFQSFNLLPRATSLRNVMLPLMYRRISDRNRQESAANALEAVGLGGRKDHMPTQLSGGECQRVAIARALVGNPSVIMADEPTGNLDSRTGEEILEVLTDLVKQGQTVIMVTHDPRLAGRANRIINMLDGAITENG